MTLQKNRKLTLKDSAQNTLNTNNIRHLKITIMVFTAVALTIINQSLFAGDYLNELANEAEATANVVINNDLDSAELKKFEKMEALLETERPSTYSFYKKLSPKNKEQVFKFYTNDKSTKSDRLSHLQSRVMDIYFNQ